MPQASLTLRWGSSRMSHGGWVFEQERFGLFQRFAVADAQEDGRRRRL